QAVSAWMAKGKHDPLAQLWAKGLALDWELMHPEPKPRRIALPAYPFARERYWILDSEKDSTPPVAAPAPWPAQVERSERILVKDWEPHPLAPQTHEPNNAIILVNAGTRALGERLMVHLAGSRLLNLADATAQGDWADCGGWIDLIGCGDERDESLAWIAPLQQLLAQGPRSGMMVLGVTRRLEAYRNAAVNLAGASRAGLYRMLQSEYARVSSRHLDSDFDLHDEALVQQIAAEFRAPGDDAQVCWRQGERSRALLREIQLASADMAPPLRSHEQALLISGGTRGIGLRCAQHFVEHHGVTRLVLTGRESFPPRAEWKALARTDTPMAHKIQAVLALEALGAQVRLSSVDLCDEGALRAELDDIRHTVGPIGGVIHSAGIVDKETPAFVRKTLDGVARVLAPKTVGLDNLIKCLGDDPLSFFVLFSSVSAAIPSLGSGQADYTMANAYMDHAAQAHCSRYPVTSIQWPSWKETGFGEIRSPAYRRTGLLALTDAQGLHLLDLILASGQRGVLLPAMVDPVLWQPRDLMHRAPARQDAASTVAGPARATAAGEVTTWLVGLLAAELGMQPAQVAVDQPLQDYGVDSIVMLQFLRAVGKIAGAELDPSILFEHPTLETFAAWLARVHGTNLSGLHAPTDEAPPLPSATSTAQPQPHPQPQPLADPGSTGDIAVVGMSCCFPGASDLDSYWTLLAEGKSAIRRVPESRWGRSGQWYAGLIDNVTHFDPQFFLLSQADARAMDPQALLVLEQSLNLLHHAGYPAAEARGRAVGVYLGARSRHVPDASRLRDASYPILSVGQNYLAANISRFFDFRGPSLVVDTACSSALVAMHMAIQALRGGDIPCALVGGVNLLQTDEPARIFSQREILNPGPDFHIFDKRAQGAVLGEGAGMVLLKTLAQAIADGDHVYAVIKSTAINNDGRTASPVAPSLQAQKDVMQTALEKSGMRAGQIDHIEVNGSGSAVTDLLELKAIESVYRSPGTLACALGSVKPNIGHLLCAEGIASFVRVALMLHRRRTVPFLSAQQPLAHYDFARSPLRFDRESAPWGGGVRTAAVSCFGDGGTNAHAIVQEPDASHNARAARQPLAPPLLRRIDLSDRQGPPIAPAVPAFWGRLSPVD
ncbi:MAG: KR domain-containing protein, partial [Ramlibacter sp.]|nr:KR domain-containing protein [Ramlibacter sp.]